VGESKINSALVKSKKGSGQGWIRRGGQLGVRRSGRRYEHCTKGPELKIDRVIGGRTAVQNRWGEEEKRINVDKQ